MRLAFGTHISEPCPGWTTVCLHPWTTVHGSPSTTPTNCPWAVLSRWLDVPCARTNLRVWVRFIHQGHSWRWGIGAVWFRPYSGRSSLCCCLSLWGRLGFRWLCLCTSRFWRRQLSPSCLLRFTCQPLIHYFRYWTPWTLQNLFFLCQKLFSN